MYKVKKNISPRYIADLFQRTEKISTEERRLFKPKIYTITHGKHSIRYIGSKLWNVLPTKIRDLPTLSVFKKHILQLDLNSLLADTQYSNCTLCSA